MKWLGGVLLAAALGLLTYFALPRPCGRTTSDVRRMEDMNSLRQIAELLVARSRHGILPMKDGALDVYRLVKTGYISGYNLKVLRSARTGVGPGGEMVRNDYTNFPWERYRGDGRLEGPPFPLLWEKASDEKGGRLVAFSDATVRYCERAEAERLLGTR